MPTSTITRSHSCSEKKTARNLELRINMMHFAVNGVLKYFF